MIPQETIVRPGVFVPPAIQAGAEYYIVAAACILLLASIALWAESRFRARR